MAWKTGPNSPLGVANGNPSTPDASAVTAVGTIREFLEDAAQGPAELIYLPGVASLAAGDIVIYDLSPGAQSVTRHSNATGSNTGRSVAVAVGAPQAGQFGWFQIGGVALVNTVAGQVAGNVMATATAGSVGNTADAGDQILNARLLTARGTPAAGQAYMQVNRPFVQGQIT